MRQYFQPVFEFVDGALARGCNVLIHCHAGAHRAGSTGVAYLMHATGMDLDAAIHAARLCRAVIHPYGRLLELLRMLDAARAGTAAAAAGWSASVAPSVRRRQHDVARPEPSAPPPPQPQQPASFARHRPPELAGMSSDSADARMPGFNSAVAVRLPADFETATASEARGGEQVPCAVGSEGQLDPRLDL